MATSSLCCLSQSHAGRQTGWTGWSQGRRESVQREALIFFKRFTTQIMGTHCTTLRLQYCTSSPTATITTTTKTTTTTTTTSILLNHIAILFHSNPLSTCSFTLEYIIKFTRFPFCKFSQHEWLVCHVKYLMAVYIINN